MVTKLQALTEAKRLLGEENIPDWQLSAEYILAVALKCEHCDLYKIESLTDRQFKKYLKLIGQRCRHIPLDKIIGYTEFFSLKIPYNHNKIKCFAEYSYYFFASVNNMYNFCKPIHNIIVRFIVRIMPNGLREWVYKNIVR